MMRRDVLMVAAVSAGLMLASATARAQSPCATSKIAFVQGQVVLNSMPKYIQAESLLAKDVDAYKLEIQKAQAALDSAAQAYQDRSAMLSASQKAVENTKLQAQNQQNQQRATDLQQKASQRQQELLLPIEQRVQEIIDGMRAEYSCAIIFDANAPNVGIASVDKSLDLTQRVIDRLKAAGDAPVPDTTKPTSGIKPPAATVPRKP